MNHRPKTPLLDEIKSIQDLRHLPRKKLRQLADELRAETIDVVSETGGHLGAGLGVVELTVALHHVFDTPNDKIIWDVGHQAYPHKILTGRRAQMRSLRSENGLSGFTKRSESPFDPFGAGHSSTSISAGLGMAVGADLKGEHRNIIAVIGDGAMSAGMAYEAMNNAGTMDARLIVILNDNDMSIASPTGAMSKYLASLDKTKANTSEPADAIGFEEIEHVLSKGDIERLFGNGSTLFETLGFTYIGPIDGHNIDQLASIFETVRDGENRPILIHTLTKKGKGYAPAENASDKFHGVSKFNVVTGAQSKPASNAPSYTSIFAQSLIQEAELDDKIVAITAAMPSGTGLDQFAKQFAERCFDVGIAEQHAVTFAAGLATEGLSPFCAIYSTFLQRGYDQVVHDVAIQNLPVRFAIDRAGFVGADGPTHAGAFDTAYLGAIPNMVLMAPGDEAELKHMVRTAAAFDEHPIAFRYPRGEGIGVELPERGKILEIGKGRIMSEGTSVALLSFGGRLAETIAAAEILSTFGISTTVADARFAKPIDVELVERLAKSHEVLITIEEGSIGGFGSFVLAHLAQNGLLDNGLKVRPLFIPDQHFDHASQDRMYAKAGLDRNGIAATAMRAIGNEKAANKVLANQIDG